MSKFRKALNVFTELQESSASHSDRNDVKLSYERKKRQGVKKRSGSRSEADGLRPVAHRQQVDEPMPAQSVDISAASLAKAGLSPNEEDLEIISQQFRRIKRPLIQAAFEADLPTGDNANVIMMASAMPGAGKSFCAYNLSQSISMERDVGAVLVDADVLKPGISRSMGLVDNVGLIDYLLDPMIAMSDILVATGLNDIIVIPAGRRHPQATELLASRRMQELVGLLSAEYANRAVIFDTPPLLLTNEAQVLAERMGQIVLVIEARVSSQDSVMRALGMLDRSKPINAILNKSRSAAGNGYQGDDYGYYPYAHRSESYETDS